MERRTGFAALVSELASLWVGSMRVRGCLRTGSGVPAVAPSIILSQIGAVRPMAGVIRSQPGVQSLQLGYARVSLRLTPAQLAKAKRLAGDWRPKKSNNIAPIRLREMF